MSVIKPAALEALRYPAFARYAAARFLATIAWQMLNVAVGWRVYEITRDPLALGLVGLAQFLPFLLLVLPAGQLADRLDRRMILAFAYAIEATATAVLLVLLLRGSTAMWPIFVAMGFFGAGRALWMPAGQAMTPNLVPNHVFPAAVALNSALFQGAVISGPAIGGVLYLLGPRVVFGSVFTLMIIVLALVFSLPPVRAASTGATWKLREVLEGLRFVLHRRPLLGAISLDLFAVLFGGATALLPIFAADVLHIGPAGLGALRTAPGVGAALAAAWLAVSPIERHTGRWMFGGVAVFGLATIVFGLSTSFWLSLVALFLLGVGDMVSVFIRHMLVQLETPDAIRGRVSAVNSMFIGASNEFGEFESGVAARAFGLVPSVVFGGAVCLGIVALYLRLFPELRTLDRFPEPRRE